MKLKELPGSLLRALALARLSIESLHDSAAPSLPIIVSFTSIPSRLPVTHLAVRSVLAGTHRPQKMVLWLHEAHQSRIPERLKQLIGERFEIRYVKADSPHVKLVPSLSAFPEHTIATCDDDSMYAADWLGALYQEHLRHPSDIIANECRAVAYDQAGNVRPYKCWLTERQKGVSHDALLPLGYAGVLYPPHCLHDDVGRADLYLKLSPRNDDLWFKAMALLKGTTTRRSSRPVAKPIPILNSQSVSLKASNVKLDGNRLQWEAIAKYYALEVAHLRTGFS